MRVITGTARGTNLYTLPSDDIRPTAQRIKEAEFSAIQFHVEGAVVLDLFAGSGQLGIEALSRGALEAVFVDNNDEAIKVIRKNLDKTKLTSKARIVKSDVFKYVSNLNKRFDIVFMDPPYGLNLSAKLVRRIGSSILDNGFLLCETEIDIDMPTETEHLILAKDYRYGKTIVWMYRKKGDDIEE